MMLNALRWWMAFFLLLPFAWRALVKWRDIFEQGRWKHFVWTGLLAIGTYNALQYSALATSSAINVTLIASSAPVWMLGFGALLYREPVTARQAVGVVLSIFGVGVTLSRGDLATLADIDFVIGDVLMLVATVAWCTYSWALARPPESMKGESRPNWNRTDYLLLQILFGLFWVTLGSGAEYALTGQRLVWSWWVAVAVIYIAIGPALLAYWCWGVGVVKGSPALSGFFVNLTPVFAAIQSSLWLRETPEPYHLLSFLFIAAGIVVFETSSR